MGTTQCSLSSASPVYCHTGGSGNRLTISTVSAGLSLFPFFSFSFSSPYLDFSGLGWPVADLQFPLEKLPAATLQ